MQKLPRRYVEKVRFSKSTRAWIRLLKYAYDYECAKCDVKLPEKELTVDHIVPRRLGGSNLFRNLTILCKRCNKAKGSNDALEFFGDERLIWIFKMNDKIIEFTRKSKLEFINKQRSNACLPLLDTV